MFVSVPNAAYYLERGRRRVSTSLPVELLVEFDRWTAERPFRSRSSMIIEAVRHFLACPSADWETGDYLEDRET